MSGISSYAFVSYASADLARVEEIIDALTTTGRRVWVDRTSISAGASYGQAIANAIRGASAVIVVCSDASMRSRNVRQEIAIAWRHQRPYVPLLIEPLPALHAEVEYWLEGAQWIEVLDKPSTEWLPQVLLALDQSEQALTPASQGIEYDTVTEISKPAHHIPVPLTPLVGRQNELGSLLELLSTNRILTMTGPGGTGKTRLALAVAHESQPHFADGVVFVDLAALQDAELVAPTIAKTIGVQEVGDQPMLTTLVDALAGSRKLLVLDNLEQVIDCGPSIATLLASCPALHVLATSRVPLHISGEQEFPVLPLALPDTGDVVQIDRIAENEAVRLFVQRARAVRPNFALTNDNAQTIAAICRRLDGLPLAIELAAARCKMLTPEALLARLEQPLKLLVGGARNLPARQQTIRDTIAWSYELLEPAEQSLLRQLSVFVGGWTIDTMEAIATPTDGDDFDPFDGLSSLVDKNLVREEEPASGDVRFRLLETIREFAQEQLAAHGEHDVYERHSTFFVNWATQADIALRGPEQPVVFRQFVAEQDNFRAVLRRSLEPGGDALIGLRLAVALSWFWFTSDQFREGRDWMTRMMARNNNASQLDRTQLDICIGLMDWRLGDSAGAAARFSGALPILQQHGDEWNVAFTLHQLAHAQFDDGYRELAGATFEQSIDRFRELGDRWGIAAGQSCIARTLHLTGDLAGARELIDRALATFQEIGDDWFLSVTMHRYGDIELALGEYEASVQHYQDSLRFAASKGDEILVADAFLRLAQIGAALGRSMVAAQLFGAAEALRDRHGVSLFEPLLPDYEQAVANVRSQLGNDEFTSRWRSGRELQLDAAVQLALQKDDGIEPINTRQS